MTFMENELAVDISTAEENINITEDTPDVVSSDDGEDLSSSEEIDIESERAEYERLIRTRFKSFYTEDTQKMINKRVKKYTALEDKLRDMEQTAKQSEARIAELEEELFGDAASNYVRAAEIEEEKSKLEEELLLLYELVM